MHTTAKNVLYKKRIVMAVLRSLIWAAPRQISFMRGKNMVSKSGDTKIVLYQHDAETIADHFIIKSTSSLDLPQ